MKMTTIGLDLAKNIFQVHGVDEQGQVVLKKSLKRTKVLPFSPTWNRVALAWRPVAARTIGRGNLNGSDTP